MESKGNPNGRILFTPAPLPKLEIRFYFFVVIICTAYAWLLVYQASQEWRESTLGGLFATDWTWIGGIKDYSNWEWHHYQPWIYSSFLWMLGHCALFKTELLVPKPFWSPMMLVYWILAVSYLTSIKTVLLCVMEAAVIYLPARVTRRVWIVWLCAISCLWINMYHLNREIGPMNVENELVLIMVTTYKVLQFISFNLAVLSQPELENRSLTGGFYDLLWYSFYLPYLVSLVQIYPKFREDFASRNERFCEVKNIASFSVRLVCWFFFADLIRNFFYFDAIILSPDTLNTLPLATLVSVGYVTGTFFFIKYHVIFGYPSILAKIDKMCPPEPPSCICRISLYSQMWRSFDRGLYQFFKHHIFTPIAEPSFSLSRKILGLGVSYIFVLTWHGWSHKYIIWVILNIIPLLGEQVLRQIYALYFRDSREKYVSDVNFRRFLAWLQIWPLAFGTYATFYFLSSSESGYVFVRRIFWGETVTFRKPFWYLIAFGYCFCQCAIECGLWKKKRTSHEKIVVKNETVLNKTL